MSNSFNQRLPGYRGWRLGPVNLDAGKGLKRAWSDSRRVRSRYKTGFGFFWVSSSGSLREAKSTNPPERTDEDMMSMPCRALALHEYLQMTSQHSLARDV